jgi:hypothetical protein
MLRENRGQRAGRDAESTGAVAAIVVAHGVFRVRFEVRVAAAVNRMRRAMPTRYHIVLDAARRAGPAAPQRRTAGPGAVRSGTDIVFVRSL